MKFDKSKADPFLLEPGDYYFEILEAKDTAYERGSETIPQIELLLRLTWETEQGERTSLFKQWLCSEKWLDKLKQFLFSVGLSEAWDAEEVDSSDLFGLSGSLRIGQYEQKTTKKIKNCVEEWYELEEVEAPKKVKKKPKVSAKKDFYSPDVQDDIPF